MSTETLLLVGALALSCIAFGKLLLRRPVVLACSALILAATVAIQWKLFQTRTLARVELVGRLAKDAPHLGRETEYVSSNRCKSCHPAEHTSWHRSFHRTMTQLALPENVVGAFDGSTISSKGLDYRVYRKGDECWAEMPDPDQMMYIVQGESNGISKRIAPGKYLVKKGGKFQELDLKDIPRVQRRVVMTTGSHHYQTYWVAGDKRFGRLLQTLPLVYLIKDQRWIPREAAFMTPPDSPRFITQWNHHCINCHSTGGVPGLVDKGQESWFDTRVGELGIACEACHGPGEEHIRRNQDPLRRYHLHWTGKSDDTIVNPQKLSHERSSEICGQCHGVFIRVGEHGMNYARQGILFRPGENLHDKRYYIQHPQNDAFQDRAEDVERNPSFFRERWWEDGSVLAGGREYTAMAVTGCYLRGEISCLSCHSMHESPPADQLKVGMRENASCVQCHSDAEFTSDVSRHTFHAASSSGSDCMNCHMPHNTYALFSAIRNHQIASPNITSSIRHGVPNACNLCHLDKTLAWTQQHVGDWYGHESNELSSEQESVSAALLWLLKGHAAQRVVVAWHFGWGPARETSGDDWLAPLLAPLLKDPYGVVRYVAEQSLRELPEFQGMQYDFQGPESELTRHASNVATAWQQNRSEPPSRTGDEVLIDTDGKLQVSRIEALLSERDNRPVAIKE